MSSRDGSEKRSNHRVATWAAPPNTPNSLSSVGLRSQQMTAAESQSPHTDHRRGTSPTCQRSSSPVNRDFADSDAVIPEGSSPSSTTDQKAVEEEETWAVEYKASTVSVRNIACSTESKTDDLLADYVEYMSRLCPWKDAILPGDRKLLELVYRSAITWRSRSYRCRQQQLRESATSRNNRRRHSCSPAAPPCVSPPPPCPPPPPPPLPPAGCSKACGNVVSSECVSTKPGRRKPTTPCKKSQPSPCASVSSCCSSQPQCCPQPTCCPPVAGRSKHSTPNIVLPKPKCDQQVPGIFIYVGPPVGISMGPNETGGIVITPHQEATSTADQSRRQSESGKQKTRPASSKSVSIKTPSDGTYTVSDEQLISGPTSPVYRQPLLREPGPFAAQFRTTKDEDGVKSDACAQLRLNAKNHKDGANDNAPSVVQQTARRRRKTSSKCKSPHDHNL